MGDLRPEAQVKGCSLLSFTAFTLNKKLAVCAAMSVVLFMLQKYIKNIYSEKKIIHNRFHPFIRGFDKQRFLFCNNVDLTTFNQMRHLCITNSHPIGADPGHSGSHRGAVAEGHRRADVYSAGECRRILYGFARVRWLQAMLLRHPLYAFGR